MKHFYTIICTIFFLNNCTIGQGYTPREAPDEILNCLEEMGIDTVPLLNEYESIFFNFLFLDKRGSFDFRDKKIAFLSGSTGSLRITKKRFFDLKKEDYKIKGYLDMNPWYQLFVLKKEVGEQLGYDAVVISWCKKLLSEKDVIKRIGKP